MFPQGRRPVRLPARGPLAAVGLPLRLDAVPGDPDRHDRRGGRGVRAGSSACCGRRSRRRLALAGPHPRAGRRAVRAARPPDGAPARRSRSACRGSGCSGIGDRAAAHLDQRAGRPARRRGSRPSSPRPRSLALGGADRPRASRIGRQRRRRRANFGHGHFWGAAPFTLALLPVIGAAMVGSLFSSDAWNNVTFAAAEVKNPRRNLPLALAAGHAARERAVRAGQRRLPERAAASRDPGRAAGPRRHGGGAGRSSAAPASRSWRSRS